MRKRTRNEANKENPEMKGSMMEELAKEELELLEAQYPNQHEYLKHELKSFIFQLQTKNLDSELLLEHNHCNNHFVFLDTEGFPLLFFFLLLYVLSCWFFRYIVFHVKQNPQAWRGKRRALTVV